MHPDNAESRSRSKWIIIQDPCFDVLRNSIYHVDRRDWLRLCDKLLKFGIIMFGTGALLKFSGVFLRDNSWVEMVVVFLAVIEIIVNPAELAHVHDRLQDRYCMLYAELRKTIDLDKDRFDKMCEEIGRLSAEEPATMRAVEALSHNNAARAIINDDTELKKHIKKISRMQIYLRNIIAFNNTEFSYFIEKPDQVKL